MNNKQLRRFPHDSVIGGVAAGLADYFGIDKALMRVIFAVLLIASHGFPMFLIYIILWVALPKDETYHSSQTFATQPNVGHSPTDWSKSTQLIGYSLILIGAFLLFDRLFYWIDLERFVPAALFIGLGGYLIWRNNEQKKQLSVETPTYGAPTAFESSVSEATPTEPTEKKPSIFDEPEEGTPDAGR